MFTYNLILFLKTDHVFDFHFYMIEPKVDFGKFWQDYTRELVPVLAKSKCKINDTTVRAYLRNRTIPDVAIIDEMYCEDLINPNGYRSCVLAHICLPENCNIKPNALFFTPSQTGCLSKEYLNAHKCTNKERVFQVKIKT